MWTVAASTNSSYLRAVANGFRRSSYLQAWHAVRHLVRRSADSPGWLFIRARVYTKRGLTCANGDDLPGLAAQDAAVQDVAEELRSLHLGVTPFRYLAGARSMRDPFGVGLLPHRAGARPVSDRDPTAGAGGHRVHHAQQRLRPVRAEPDNGMLLPFEGMGVDTVWRLELPSRPTRSTSGPSPAAPLPEATGSNTR